MKGKVIPKTLDCKNPISFAHTLAFSEDYVRIIAFYCPNKEISLRRHRNYFH
jgi:hypothetical protein